MLKRKAGSLHVYFIASLVLVVLGCGILFLTTGLASGLCQLWPLAAFIAAVLYAYAGIVRRRYSHALYLGSFAACAAVLALVMALTGVKLQDYWPLYAVLAGLCLVPAGYMRARRFTPGFIVPAVSLVALGLFLSVFSFGFSAMSFRSFIAIWWPGLFVAAGLVLFAVWLLNRGQQGNAKEASHSP